MDYDIGTEIRKIRSLVGYMPENDAFISKMSAVSFVQMMGELSGLPSDMALERAHEALFYVGLAEARYRQLGTYSLGMKQLAKLAQAIVHGPKLLILDEPTNGLDPSARQRMIRMIREIRDGQEMRIVLCSHLLRDVEDTCDEVLILKQGRIAHYSNLDEERRANKRFLELEIYGANGDFTEAIERLGCECAVTGEPHEDDSGGWGRDPRHFPAGGGTPGPHPAAEFPARHARGYFPEGHGELTCNLTGPRSTDGCLQA